MTSKGSYWEEMDAKWSAMISALCWEEKFLSTCSGNENEPHVVSSPGRTQSFLRAEYELPRVPFLTSSMTLQYCLTNFYSDPLQKYQLFIHGFSKFLDSEYRYVQDFPGTK